MITLGLSRQVADRRLRAALMGAYGRALIQIGCIALTMTFGTFLFRNTVVVNATWLELFLVGGVGVALVVLGLLLRRWESRCRG